MSDREPGEYKHLSRSPVNRRSRSKSGSYRSGSRKSGSVCRSLSRSRSRSYRSRSGSPRRRSRTPDKYGGRNGRRRSRYNTRSRSGSRSRSRSRSYSRGRDSRSPMSSRKRHIGDRMDPPASKCLGVFGLSLYTTEGDLRSVFSRYGRLSSINVVIDQKTGRSRGFGFVYFDHEDDACEAKERANGMELDGRRIRVDYSITKRAHTPTPGVYVGRPYSRAPPRDFDRYGGGGGGGGGRYDRRDDYGGRRDSYRRSPSPYYRGRRSPSPYYRGRRSPSPYYRDSYRDRSPRRY